jgi:hypothetical protein
VVTSKRGLAEELCRLMVEEPEAGETAWEAAIDSTSSMEWPCQPKLTFIMA